MKKPTWRRRFIRLLGWAIGAAASVLAVALLLFTVYLVFFDYSETLRQGLETQLSNISGGRARIGQFYVDLPNQAFELRNITVAVPGSDADADSEQELLRLERVRGQLDVTGILSLQLHWKELRLEGLVLHVADREADAEAGAPAVAVPSVDDVPVAGVAVIADKILLQDAVILYENERQPWTLEASNLDIAIEREGNRYVGHLAYEDGQLRIKDRPEIEASVEADFELSGREVFVESIRASTGFAEVAGRGKLSLTGGPRGRFEVEAQADWIRAVRTFVDLGPLEAASADPLSFRGTLELTPGDRLLQGTLELPRAELRGIPLSGWQGELHWDRTLLQIPYATGQVAGGAARLQIHQPLPSAEHDAAVDLDFRGSSLERILEGVTGRSPLAARLNGRASLSFPPSDPRAVTGVFEIEGDPSESLDTAVGVSEPAVATEPVSFSARGTLDKGDVRIEAGAIETRSFDARLRGLYPRHGSADLSLELVSEALAGTDRLQRSLRDLLPREPAASTPELWGIDGRGRTQGRITRRLPHLAYRGSFEGFGVRFEGVDWGHVRIQGRLAEGQFHFDRLDAVKDGAQVRGQGQVALGRASGSHDFQVAVELSDWPGQDLFDLLAVELPLEAALEGDVMVARRAGALRGRVSIRAAEGRLAGEPIDGGRIDVAFEGDRVEVETLVVEREGQPLGGSLALHLPTGALNGRLETRSFPFELSAEAAAVRLSGVLEGGVDIAGTLETPELALEARTAKLDFGGATLGAAALEATLRDGLLEASFRGGADGSGFSVEISDRVKDDAPLEGRLSFHELELGPWLRLRGLPLPETVRTLADGRGRFRYRLDSGTMEAEARIENLLLEGEGYRFVASRPMELRLENELLELGQLVFSEEAGQFTLGGRVDLAEQSLDLEAVGVVGLPLLEGYYPFLATTGEVDVSAKIRGSWSRPSLTGYAEFRSASLRLERFPQTLANLRGRLVFDNRTIRIPELSGVFGSGPVTISGDISLAGFAPGSMDLRLQGSGMRLRYPEDFVATIDADLNLLGTSEGQVLTGRLTFQDAVWSREYDLASGILVDREGGFELFEEAEEAFPFENLRFDLELHAPDSLHFRNSLANIDAAADLELRGSFESPVLLGRSEASRGEVFFLGQRYNITNGKVDFVDPTRIQPFFDLTAEARVRSYRVELRLTGTPERFNPELTSDPPLRTVDILRLLAGASERDILVGNEEEELAGVGVASLLTERLSQEVGRRAERLFGLDRFSIDPFLIGQFANPTARVSLGKQITRDISINYSTNLNETTEAIVLIEYTPEGPVSWVFSRDETGALGVDVKFRKSF